MKTLLSIAMLVLLAVPRAFAGDEVRAAVPPPAAADGRALSLDGMCVRHKFVVDNCVGSLYTPKPVESEAELLSEPGDKLLRLDILRDKVEKERIMGLFEEGFSNNAPDIARTPDARRFLTLFRADFYKGDKVDLFLGGDGTVSASHNGTALGTIKSAPLVRGILKTWFVKPAAGASSERQAPGE
jgi:hypothetical protein